MVYAERREVSAFPSRLRKMPRPKVPRQNHCCRNCLICFTWVYRFVHVVAGVRFLIGESLVELSVEKGDEGAT